MPDHPTDEAQAFVDNLMRRAGVPRPDPTPAPPEATPTPAGAAPLEGHTPKQPHDPNVDRLAFVQSLVDRSAR